MEEQFSPVDTNPSIPAPSVAPNNVFNGYRVPEFEFKDGVPSVSPQEIEKMKARAREEAVRITLEQRRAVAQPPNIPLAPPQVVYVRRNFTVAELLLVVLLACGVVTGVQIGWNYLSTFIPRIEIRVK
jgi:RNase P subunit RPR2